MTNQDNKPYQLTCLFNTSVDMEKINQAIEKIKQVILANEGTVSEQSRFLEPVKKRLTYSINKQEEAFYWNLNFLLSPKAIDKLKQKLSQEKNIMRHMITNKKEPKPKQVKKSIDLKMIDKIEPLSDKKEPKAVKEKVEIEELDKKLEEILNQ